jgi:hypothetical protein
VFDRDFLYDNVEQTKVCKEWLTALSLKNFVFRI